MASLPLAWVTTLKQHCLACPTLGQLSTLSCQTAARWTVRSDPNRSSLSGRRRDAGACSRGLLDHEHLAYELGDIAGAHPFHDPGPVVLDRPRANAKPHRD